MTDYIILLVNRRSFLETPLFTKSWMAMNLTDDDLWNLQKELLKEPKKGSVIPQSELCEYREAGQPGGRKKACDKDY